MRQYSAPTVASGALLGLIFGLSFLDRTEGILYLAFIPFVQVVHYWFTRDRSYSSRQLVRWGATFIAVFVLLAAPQVWRVSRRMGGFAINGRQAWALFLGRDLTGVARDRKLWGLGARGWRARAPESLGDGRTGPRDRLLGRSGNLSPAGCTLLRTDIQPGVQPSRIGGADPHCWGHREGGTSPAARGLLSAPVLALVRPHGPSSLYRLPTSRVCGPISVSIHPTSYFSSTPTANFPFLKDFTGPVPPGGFQLLYRKDTPANGRLELYRVLPNATAAAARSTP